MKFWEKQHRSLMLISVLDTIRSNPLTCDFEVKFNGHVFPAHRVVLIASSGYFRRLLQGNSKETDQGFVEIEGLNGPSINDCLEYIYTGNLVVTCDNVKAILQSCHYLQIDEVKDLCFKYLQASLSPTSCFQVLQYAATYPSDSTMDAIVRFITKNYVTITETVAYQRAPFDIIIEMLRSSQTYTTKVLWQGITRWIEYDPDVRKSNLARLLKEVITYDLKYTLDVIIRYPLVEKDPEATQYLVKSVIFVQWTSFRQLINQANCFAAYEWTLRYNDDVTSELFRSVVFEYFKDNFIGVCQSEKFTSLTIVDLHALLDSVQTKLICQTVRWQAIVKWIAGYPLNETYFERLFRLLDLKNLPVEFIQKHIRPYYLVEKSHECKDAIMDAMFFHTEKTLHVNSCLLFDKTLGNLHRHFDDSWKMITSDSRLIGGSLLGSKSEMFIFNSPYLYKIRSDENIEEKRPCQCNKVVRAAVVHAGKVFVFHEDLRLSVYDITDGKWRYCFHSFDIPEDTSVCSTAKDILFLGGGCDGQFRKRYNPNFVFRAMIDVPPMNHKRRNPTCTSVGSLVFLVGGVIDVMPLIASIEMYCIKTNSWSTFKPTLPLFGFTNKLMITCCEADSGIYFASYGTKASSSDESNLLIEIVPNWNSIVISDVPRVKHPEIAGWICYEQKRERNWLAQKNSLSLSCSQSPDSSIPNPRRAIKTARRKLR